MGILNIAPVVRGQSKVILGIAGISGSGKTLTALYIARGLVSHAGEIGFLCSESGRGRLYDNALDGKFLIADLLPPFSPARYRQAIKEFQDAGVKVLIIDSVSHEWEGEGGCDDIANQKVGKMANWIGAKREHKAFMNTLLQAKMHIICCIRAREKTDFNDPNKPVSLGIQPICEKNFMFELTASMLMENEGKNQRFLKMPNFLRKAFGDGNGYIGEAAGRAMLNWIEQGESEDPEITRIKSEMLMACEQGLAAIVAIWNNLTPQQKTSLEAHKNICKESAQEYERQRKEEETEAIDKEGERMLLMLAQAKSISDLLHLKEHVREAQLEAYENKFAELSEKEV